MVERIARAIRDVNATRNGLTFHELSEAMARAAIEEMRVPTDEMRIRVAADWGHRTWRQYEDIIDAAKDLHSNV